MTLDVTLAGPRDLPAAERLMHAVLDQDLRGYRRDRHADLDDLAGHYLTAPRRALFVARLDGMLAGTAAVRPARPPVPPVPRWPADRYRSADVGELVRVWVSRAARRLGVARALVSQTARWAVDEAGYRAVHLHSDVSAPGAEAFWRALPTVELFDARPDGSDTVSFELDVEKLR